jgi:hypothetical protein
MGYNECVARIYRAENGWAVEVPMKRKPSKGPEMIVEREKTFLATDWEGVVKILNSKVEGKGADADYAEAFGAAAK